MARIVQVSISPGGVPKRPVPQARVTFRGLEGDAHTARMHGGPDQAVLLIELAWLRQLQADGFPVFPGALGENLTSEGLDLRALPPGARLRAGQALLQVTKAREPCRTIEVYGRGIGKRIYDKAAEAGDPTSVVWGASGLMLRVLEEGVVRPGDALSKE